MRSRRTTHADSRMPLILDEAARLFRSKGYEATTMRDIASAVGMLPGSLYCHFTTKDALLASVYARGVEQVSSAVEAALEGKKDPWQRLEAASIAHLEAILRDDDYAQVVVRVRPSDAPAVRQTLVALRDRYEALLGKLVGDLPLPRGTDRRAFRLLLIGGLNASQLWYRPGGRQTPRAIARSFLAFLRVGKEPSE